MTTPLVLTFVGDDRPGLVNAISEKVAASGATWLESRSVRLAGKFAGVVLISVPDDRLTELELSLQRSRARRAAHHDRARRGGGGGKAGADRQSRHPRAASGRASCAT